MQIEDSTINKCINLIKNIERRYGQVIFKKNQKRKLIGVIKDFTESDYDSKTILLQLTDNNVFEYQYKNTKKKELFYTTSSKILEDNGCTKKQINNFIYSFGLNKWQDNKARMNDLLLVLNSLLFTLVIS